MNYQLLTVSLAYILDLIMGDPAWLPHPVKGIGWLAGRVEPVFRKTFKNQRIAGFVYAIFIIGIVWALAFIMIRQAAHFNKYLGALLSIFFIYASLAIKDLKVEGMRVYQALEKDDVASARKNLSLIV